MISTVTSGGPTGLERWRRVAKFRMPPAYSAADAALPMIAREFESGTYRLCWNQSVTRARWAIAKVGLVGLAAVATAGASGKSAADARDTRSYPEELRMIWLT